MLGHFGVRGALKVAALDADAFRPGIELIVGSVGPSARRYRLSESRRQNKFLVVRLDGVHDRDTAQDLIGAHLWLRRSNLAQLPDKTFRAIDLIGFDVKDSVLGSLGKVRDVRHYPASDMLVVGDNNMLVPMLTAYGVTVNVKARQIVVSLPKGFEDL